MNKKWRTTLKIVVATAVLGVGVTWQAATVDAASSTDAQYVAKVKSTKKAPYSFGYWSTSAKRFINTASATAHHGKSVVSFRDVRQPNGVVYAQTPYGDIDKRALLSVRNLVNVGNKQIRVNSVVNANDFRKGGLNNMVGSVADAGTLNKLKNKTITTTKKYTHTDGSVWYLVSRVDNNTSGPWFIKASAVK
ncbi:MAG: hypothetical protein LBT80_08445 [Lactobacillaceae bacterium]|jgi:hypothetical protein|nr:hypothetical protein [Lactobacillaceae bacterium]